MVYDLVILILCTVRLRASSRHGGISTLLLRDGIVCPLPFVLSTPTHAEFLKGYFCAAFAANLIQSVFAALQLNPVMNILCLPFALVVSVLAATTVFRHVFEAHGAWAYTGSSGAPHQSAGSSSHGLAASAPSRGMFVRRASVLGSKGDAGIALGDLGGRHENAQVRVHRVVEVDVESMPPSHLHVRSAPLSLPFSPPLTNGCAIF